MTKKINARKFVDLCVKNMIEFSFFWCDERQEFCFDVILYNQEWVIEQNDISGLTDLWYNELVPFINCR